MEEKELCFVNVSFKLKENYIRSALKWWRNDCNLHEMFLGEA